MQLLSTFTTLLLLHLTSSATATPTPVDSSKRACTTVYPTLQVPIDSSAPDRVYGSSREVTLWKNPSGNRNMLFRFDIPTSTGSCKLKFHAVAKPPMAISGPIKINAYSLSNTFVSSTSWNGKPPRVALVGTATISVSATEPTKKTVVKQACASVINYELEVPITGSLGFTSDASNGFYMTYGC